MVLVNGLTIDDINAALIALQRGQHEVVGGVKNTTVQNISINNSGSGGPDYTPVINSLDQRVTDLEERADAVEEKQAETDELIEELSQRGIRNIYWEEQTRTLTLYTTDSQISVVIPQETVTLGIINNNILHFTMGVTENDTPQIIDVELPFINANEKGAAGGVATLDNNGRVPYSQLPESAMEYKGKWDAGTNTPHLEDGTGTNGDFYVCSAPGTVTFGTGNTITFVVNDRVIYDGTDDMWEKLPAGAVSSVNGQTGNVTLTANDIDYSSTKTVKQAIDDVQPVQADWDESDSTDPSYIQNKPPIWVASGSNSEQIGSVFDIVHPIGEVYVQYPGKKSPQALWGTISTWTDITANYDGAFFRTYKNGTSGDFFDYGTQLGNAQTSQNLAHDHNTNTSEEYAILGNSSSVTTGADSFTTATRNGSFGVDDGTSFDLHESGFVGHSNADLGADCVYCNHNDADGRLTFNHNHTIYQKKHKHTIGSDGGTEARPKNYAIRIWERTL